jgi:hypothetical protein
MGDSGVANCEKDSSALCKPDVMVGIEVTTLKVK